MTVKELIAILSKLPQSATIIALNKEGKPRLINGFDINYISSKNTFLYILTNKN